jgi:hypothetical protein
VTTPVGTINASQAGSSTAPFVVTYAASAGMTINTGTFGTGNITVNDGATVTGFSAAGNVVTYTITAPAATWGASFQGTYTISIPSNQVKDNAGNAVAANANFSSFLVDTIPPTISSVTSTTANGTYTTGANINVTVNFSEAVTLSGGNLKANLNDGGTVTITPFANSTSASGTYTVAAGQNANPLDSNSPLVLAGGTTLQDQAGNNISSLNIPAGQSLANLKNIVIDTVAPVVTNVTSSTPDGTYSAPGTISIQVSFSKPVTVTGTPVLALNSGASAKASYTSGSGTSTLTFTYIVSSGDSTPHLDYTSANALTLPGGATIVQTAAGGTNNANLTLAAPGAVGSLGFNKNIVINDDPLITAGPSASPNPVPFGSTSTTLSVTATDGDDPSANLTYTWSLLSGAGGVTFNGTNGSSTIGASLSAPGNYVFQVAVADGRGGVTTVSLTVTLPGPPAPPPPAPPPIPTPTPIPSTTASTLNLPPFEDVAFTPDGSQQVTELVDRNGNLTQFDGGGSHKLATGIRSASVVFGSSGEIMVLVNSAGQLIQIDSKGAHLLASGVLSADVSLSGGQEVLEVVFLGGLLFQFDSTGTHQLGTGVQSASVAFGATGEVMAVVYQTGVLFQFDASGTHQLATGVIAAGVGFAPSANDLTFGTLPSIEALDVVFSNHNVFQFNPFSKGQFIGTV